MPQLPDLSGLARVLGLVVAFLGAYLFALWVSMLIWTFRDVRARSRDIFTQVLAVAMVLIFNVAGLLLYFILRPRETLAEKYERELAEEAMLQDIEERQVCPLCHHKIAAEYLLCPNCHTKLHKKCENCGRTLNLKWNVCPYCAEPQAVPQVTRPVVETPPAPPIRKREPVLQPIHPVPPAKPGPVLAPVAAVDKLEAQTPPPAQPAQKPLTPHEAGQ